ncbi:bifunctional [glutamine synthetase] adenylyltransferase/[glutamine synthetase]-adenylyl-L-tyrosine phosphorylase, partial [Rhizobium sp. TRM95111]|nr:bifunctional [glutamine synthetase] adenylyltransferase/[glutamine synthetase]-adenylyl-L-tyrosine phosphorylase [Rhizobium alarense]
MSITETTRLSDLAESPIRALSQTEARSATADLKAIGQDHPAIAGLLAGTSALRDFLVAALSLSPFLRDTATVSPTLLVRAVTEPLLPQVYAAITAARTAWDAAAHADVSENAVMAR